MRPANPDPATKCASTVYRKPLSSKYLSRKGRCFCYSLQQGDHLAAEPSSDEGAIGRSAALHEDFFDLQEKKMLSPHEFVTLMLVRDAPDQSDLNALLERQLVALEKLASGCMSLNVTEQGYSFLRAVTRKN